MALNTLTLSTTSASYGQAFSATIGGRTAGSKLYLDAASRDGFFVVNDTLWSLSVPAGIINIGLGEVAPTGERKVTQIVINGTFGSGVGGSSLDMSPSSIDPALTGIVAQLSSSLTGIVTYSKLSGASSIAIAASGVVTVSSALGVNGSATFVARAQNAAGDAVEKSLTLSAGAGGGTTPTPSPATIVSGTRRTVVTGQNVGAYGSGKAETVRVWDNSNVNCYNPRAYFQMGKTNPSPSGYAEFPVTQPSTHLKYSVLTNITDRTLKNQSAATEIPVTFNEFAATPDFLGWGGSVTADGRELTMPPARIVEAVSWANGILTVTFAGSAAGISPGQVIDFTGAAPTTYTRQEVVKTSAGAAGKTVTFDAPVDPGVNTTLPVAARVWFPFSDKITGWNAKQVNGYFHKVFHSAPTAFAARIANLPVMRPDLGDLAGGDFSTNDWTAYSGATNCLIPYLLGEGDAGVKLVVVDGDSITSQNGGTWPLSVDEGDASGVMGSVKRALNRNGATWIDISVPGTSADLRVSTFNPAVTATNVASFRYNFFLPLADFVISRMLHNDRRSWSTSFDNALRPRYENDNAFLRSKMKAGAKLGRVALLGSLGMPKFTAISQTGTTVTATLPSVSQLAVGDQFEANIGSGATASLSSDIVVSAVSQTTNVMTLTTVSTVGMTVGDRLRWTTSGVYLTNYAPARDISGLVVVTGIVNATTFTVAATNSQTRSDTANNTLTAVRRIKAIAGNQITYDHPAGLDGAGALGSGGITFNNRWRTIDIQVPGNDDSDMSDMTNVNKGGVPPFTILGEAQARPWRAFIAKCRGQANTFRLPATRGMQITGITPRVNGGGQAGYSLTTDGWGSDGAKLFAGQFVTINEQLLLLTDDVVSNGGAARITFEPHNRLRLRPYPDQAHRQQQEDRKPVRQRGPAEPDDDRRQGP